MLRAATELGVVQNEPQEGVSVQQEFHSWYSRNSSRGASKSSRMVINPLALPARRRRFLGLTGTILTTGHWSFVIRTSSPRTAAATKSENRPGAASIST